MRSVLLEPTTATAHYISRTESGVLYSQKAVSIYPCTRRLDPHQTTGRDWNEAGSADVLFSVSSDIPRSLVPFPNYTR